MERLELPLTNGKVFQNTEKSQFTKKRSVIPGSAIAYITARNKMPHEIFIDSHAPTRKNSMINEVTRRNFCLAGGVLTFFPFAAQTQRRLRDDVIFAGVTQLGNADEFSKIMPFTSAIMEKKTPKGQRIIDQAFRKALGEYPPEYLTLIDSGNSTKKDDCQEIVRGQVTGYVKS